MKDEINRAAKLAGAKLRQLEAKRKILSNWEGPKSVCQCGHTGDQPPNSVQNGAHLGLIGHGACSANRCKCVKFTWRGYVPDLQAKLDAC